MRPIWSLIKTKYHKNTPLAFCLKRLIKIRKMEACRNVFCDGSRVRSLFKKILIFLTRTGESRVRGHKQSQEKTCNIPMACLQGVPL